MRPGDRSRNSQPDLPINERLRRGPLSRRLPARSLRRQSLRRRSIGRDRRESPTGSMAATSPPGSGRTTSRPPFEYSAGTGGRVGTRDRRLRVPRSGGQPRLSRSHKRYFPSMGGQANHRRIAAQSAIHARLSWLHSCPLRPTLNEEVAKSDPDWFSAQPSQAMQPPVGSPLRTPPRRLLAHKAHKLSPNAHTQRNASTTYRLDIYPSPKVRMTREPLLAFFSHPGLKRAPHTGCQTFEVH